MRSKFLLVSLLCVFIQLSASNLLYDITDGVYKAQSSQTPVSMQDGEHYTLMIDNQMVVKYSYKTGVAVDTLLSLKQVSLAPIKTFEGYIMSPGERYILIYNNKQMRFRRSFTADYYIYDTKYKEFDPLSANAPQASPVFSPDGRYIAFAHNYNLYMKKVDFKTDIQITKDGAKGKISNGIPDWLYEEEFETTCHYAWSPDSKLLAYVKFDESKVKDFSFQNFLQENKIDYLLYPNLTTFKYPKAGEQNTEAKLYVYDDFNKRTQHIKLQADKDSYIPRFKWRSYDNQLAVFQLNRNQNQLNMYVVNPLSTLSKMIYREESKTYIDYKNTDNVFFSEKNGSFYLLSSRDGYRHIYQYNKDGSLLKQITKGDWDITDFYGVNENTGIVYYQSAELSPIERQVYAIDAKGKKTNLTDAKGTNRAYFSTTFSYFIHQNGNLTTPDNYVVRNSAAKLIRALASNKDLQDKFQNLELSQKEFFSFKTSDGTRLNGWMMKPKQLNNTKKHPVLMIQYSGPNSQLVLDKWDIGWEYFLSTQGYVVVCVDGRGTGARGKNFTDAGYLRLGVREAQDQIEAAQYLASLNFVDKERIGIWGWSYGGTVTLMAMSSGKKVFKAGVSIAPVTDWRFYNTAYTERFMRTPEQNLKGYEESSALLKAEKLSGRLLLIHSSADDNVHYANTMVYVDRLVQADKQFEMQIYTDKNHSILGKQTRRHLYQRMFDFLEKELRN